MQTTKITPQGRLHSIFRPSLRTSLHSHLQFTVFLKYFDSPMRIMNSVPEKKVSCKLESRSMRKSILFTKDRVLHSTLRRRLSENNILSMWKRLEYHYDLNFYTNTCVTWCNFLFGDVLAYEDTNNFAYRWSFQRIRVPQSIWYYFFSSFMMDLDVFFKKQDNSRLIFYKASKPPL